MRVFDVIERKKNRAELTREELRFFCRAVASEEATDSQIAAFCMAVLLNGMTDRECANLTLAMTESGETLPRPQGGGRVRGQAFHGRRVRFDHARARARSERAGRQMRQTFGAGTGAHGRYAG